MTHKLTNVSEATARNYEKALDELVYFFENKQIADITVQEAYRFVEYLRFDKRQYRGVRGKADNSKVGLKLSSVNGYLSLVRSSYEVLRLLGYIEEEHCVFHDVEDLKVQKSPPRTVHPEDLNKFLRALEVNYYVDLRLKVLVYVFLESYGRAGEVLNLKKEDVDLEKGLVTFTRTKNREFRVVPISRKTTNLIKKMIKENEEFDSEYIFLSNVGDKLNPDSLRVHMYQVSDRAGIKSRITPHRLRHTGATEAIANGMNPRALQKLLGHQRLETTEIYASVSDETLQHSQDEYSPLSILEKAPKRKMKNHKRRK